MKTFPSVISQSFMRSHCALDVLNTRRRARLSSLMISLGIMTMTALLGSCVVGALSHAGATPLVLKGDTFRAQPKLWLSSEYDTNVFYEAALEPTGNLPNTGALIKAGLGLILQNRQQKNVSFNLDASSAYRQYVYLDDSNGRPEAELDKLRQGRSGVDYARLIGGLILGTQSDIQLIISERFNYIERPAYESTVYGFERVDNRLSTAVDFAPGRRGGGGPLGIQLGYELRNISFLNDGEGLPIQGRSEKQSHTLSLDSRWRFLPKNFLTLDFSYTSNDYNDFERDLEEDETPEETSRDSNPLRVELGLTGLITKRFSVFLKGGYGNTFNKNGASFEGFVGLFQLSYIYAPVAELSVGYQRDGQDSGFSNFYTLDRVYVKGALRISNKLSITSNLSYDLYQYDASNAVDNAERTDPVLRAQVAVRAYMPSHFSIQAAYSVENNYSEYQLPLNQPLDFAAYQRHLFSLALYFN